MLKKLFLFNRNDLALLWLVLPAIVFVFVNRFSQQSMPVDLLEQIQIYQDNYYPEKADVILLSLLDQEPLDLDLNYRYIQNHFEIITVRGENQRDDKTIHDRYVRLTHQAETFDVGNYGLGYIESRQKNYPAALGYFMKVGNREQKYLNNSIGYAYKSLGDEEQAEGYFKREIALDGNLQGAVVNLVDLYKKQGEFKKLRSLVRDQHTAPYVGVDAKSYVALRSGQVFQYLEILYIQPFGYLNGYAAACALLICAIWFIYLRRINLFSLEPKYWAIFALISGALMALTCIFLYDLWFIMNPINPGEGWLKDLIYCIFHIGVIEEMVKFIPVVVIVLLVNERINDPLDLVTYGGLSALGFATIENSLYFSVFGIRIVFARFILSTVLHMAMTMIICYFWARARYMKPGNDFHAILVGFGIAALSHGLFDFIGISDNPTYLLFFPFIIAILVYLFRRILDNCIMDSARQVFIQTSLTNRHLNNYHLLFLTAAVLLVISYLYDNFHYATEIANRNFTIMSLFTILSVGIVFYPLVNIGLPKTRISPTFNKKMSLIPVKPSKNTPKK